MAREGGRMSGWENVPEEAPKPPGPQRKRQAAAATAAPQAALDDAATVEDSEFAQFVDMYWPQAWMMMLAIVSLIGIWAAIGKLPNHPSWLP